MGTPEREADANTADDLTDLPGNQQPAEEPPPIDHTPVKPLTAPDETKGG